MGIKRRQFIKYSSLGVVGLSLAACSQQAKQKSPVFSPSDMGKLEKDNPLLAYIPSADAAPLIIAKEKGFFDRYGLKVNLTRQTDWNTVEKGLREWRFDLAQIPYALPLIARLRPQNIPLTALMTLNGNGSAITLPSKAWDAGLRPAYYYRNFSEFSNHYREYHRKFGKPLSLGVESLTSLDAYLYRYWLGAMGINSSTEAKWAEVAPSQLRYKMQAGILNGYMAAEPWNQIAVANKLGFVTHTSQDIWQGHPSKVLGVMQGWADKHPTTTRAMIAALLQACQFCQAPENRSEVATLLAQSHYLNLDSALIEASLGGVYHYEQLDQPPSNGVKLADLSLFHYQKTPYLEKPDHINYPWRSHGVWLLTQLVRWQQFGLKEYSSQTEALLDKAYPVGIYEEVAKGLKIDLPSDRLKQEPASVFIDQHPFDPSQPVAYLSQFTTRAT
jgi:nitrate/nitrite transport system substrate-binding protein